MASWFGLRLKVPQKSIEKMQRADCVTKKCHLHECLGKFGGLITPASLARTNLVALGS
jgi:hypothetical protein